MRTITLDNISFGNPNLQDYELMQKETYLDPILPELKRLRPPANSSNATMQEFKDLGRYIHAPRDSRNHLYDEALLDAIKNHFVKAGADRAFVDEVARSVANDVIPIVTKLKYHFNRPRPSQLAYYLGIKYFPNFSFFVNNPSYPSGHTTLTWVTCNVLGNLHPRAFQSVLPVINDAQASRLLLGVHYPSDNEMAIKVASRILDFPEFKYNYKL